MEDVGRVDRYGTEAQTDDVAKATVSGMKAHTYTGKALSKTITCKVVIK